MDFVSTSLSTFDSLTIPLVSTAIVTPTVIVCTRRLAPVVIFGKPSTKEYSYGFSSSSVLSSSRPYPAFLSSWPHPHVMLCVNPYVRDPSGKVFRMSTITGNPDLKTHGIPFPCGHCLPCLVRKAREWSSRLLLESYAYSPSDICFVTLTYSDEELYYEKGVPSLDKQGIQRFLKRFRYFAEPSVIRFYLRGEYGPTTLRPHYHALLFGIHSAHAEGLASRAWNHGFSSVQASGDGAFSYLSGYTTSKLAGGDTAPLHAQKPFVLASRRPGLGFPFLITLADRIKKDEVLLAKFRNGDLTVSHEGVRIPFDRYVRGSLSKLLGVVPSTENYSDELFARNEQAKSLGVTLTEALLEESRQRVRQITAKHRRSLSQYNSKD